MNFTTLALTVAATVVVAAGILSLALLVRNYLKYRGDSVVNCPETHKSAGVRVNAWQAALASLPGRSGKIQLERCSRWPDRQQCRQQCLSQIQHDTNLCHVSAMAAQWYVGRECALCGRPIGKIHQHGHAPALLGREHQTVTWNEVLPENLPHALQTHLPLCWSCHMAETFRQRFPQRVVNRPWKRGAMGEYIGEERETSGEQPRGN